MLISSINSAEENWISKTCKRNENFCETRNLKWNVLKKDFALETLHKKCVGKERFM